MLDPRSRGALLEALRPPAGYTVDAAVATTYSLDLIALLTAPLAFSLYDRLASRETNGPDRVDSFALLHAVRRHAERLVVFCQAGCIAKPKGYRQLLAYLEDAVVEVNPREGNGVFHPKVWVVRLTNGESVRYRVLCLSRNLTFDRSWDTMLAFDGELADRTRAISESKPLAEFVRALPGLARDGVSTPRREMVEMMADELERVRFEVPEPFESFRFWPMGLAGKQAKPFGDAGIQRLLVVSPFVEAPRVTTLAEQGRGHILVSRFEELSAVPKDALAPYAERMYILHDAANDLEDAEPIEEDGDLASFATTPTGLHAKLYVADDGWNAHVWTGSANASNAAFGSNVEMLVQLTGKKSKVGVDAFFGTEDAGLRSLLVPFSPPEAPVGPDPINRRLEELISTANRRLSRASWKASAVRDKGSDEEKPTFTVTLDCEGGAPAVDAGCEVRVWPIALPQDRGLALVPSTSLTFESCSFLALTAFFAFELTALFDGRTKKSVFVLRVPLLGVPEDRSARVLHALLDDPNKVLRFLKMLLAADGTAAMDLLGPARWIAGGSKGVRVFCR